MGLNIDYIEGQTPLDEEEMEALLIPTVTSRNELDEFEQQNIENAIAFYWNRNITIDKFFTEEFIKEVHRKMFGDVWRWAGKFRTTNKNLGVDKWSIASSLKNLLDDALYWVNNNIYDHDEIAIRFKHRLESIHCFSNGNGRHSRLMADLLMYRVYKDNQPFSWGVVGLVKKGEARASYLSALKDADNGNFQPLINFAKS
ncbi:MAG: mobile mystery protein B [Niabella sp.]